MLAMMEESMMRQKAMIRWLELRDRNTSHFLSTMKRRHNKNAIYSLTREDGVVLTNPVEVRAEVVRYFSTLFSATAQRVPLNEEMNMLVIRG